MVGRVVDAFSELGLLLFSHGNDVLDEDGALRRTLGNVQQSCGADPRLSSGMEVFVGAGFVCPNVDEIKVTSRTEIADKVF